MLDPLIQNAMRLYQAGQVPEAMETCRRILGITPQHFGALYFLGSVLLQTGQFDEAEKILARAADAEPKNVDAWYGRGCALYRLNRREEAIVCFDRAVDIDPDFAEAFTNRAVLQLELDRAEDALESCDRALAAKPDFVLAIINRGNALAALKRYEQAISSYDKALAIAPDLPEALENRANAVFEMGHATRCPPGYMRRLFDGFSVDYDAKMVDALGYRAHLHLRTLADRVMPDAAAPMRILDLGSGTGLVGEEFKALAKGGRLDGIDLAPRMIEAARVRGIYDDLILADLEDALAADGLAYDLILAADTMIYLGDLAPTFTGVAKRLEPGGRYLFAVEAKQGEGWEQTPDNRFRHSLVYLKDEAARVGLEFVCSIDCILRQQPNAPVDGFAVALRKPA